MNILNILNKSGEIILSIEGADLSGDSGDIHRWHGDRRRGLWRRSAAAGDNRGKGTGTGNEREQTTNLHET